MLCICRWMSERYLRSISQAQRRMKSVLCYAKPSPIARNTAFPPFLSVSCQGWVVMRSRCLPLSRNSLTVAPTSISRRSSSTCLGMTASHPCLHLSCWQHSPLVHNWRKITSPFACSQEESNISPKVANLAASPVQRNQLTRRKKNARKPFPF